MKTLERIEDSRTTQERGSGFAPARGSVAVHYMSETVEWATPQEFFDRLNAMHNFTLDCCSTHANAKCERHYTAAENGLAHSWQNERVWMNPPYGRVISDWMKKAYEESCGSALVVCLVPARTDTAWWHDYAAKGEIHFVRGRLKFGAGKNSAPFPSAVITFKPLNDPDVCGRLAHSSLHPVVMRLRRAHWWCGACNWRGQTEDSIGANEAGKLCCPKCGNTDVREKGSPLFKAA